MTKATKSKYQRKSEAKPLTSSRPTSSPKINTPTNASEVLLDCIRTEDLNSFRNVLISCLTTMNKTHFAQSAGIGRQTLYDMIDLKKSFNPELSTIAAIIRALAHEGKSSHV